MTWRELDDEHSKGIFHKENECCWCDHVRQLEKEGYYDFLKYKGSEM